MAAAENNVKLDTYLNFKASSFTKLIQLFLARSFATLLVLLLCKFLLLFLSHSCSLSPRKENNIVHFCESERVSLKARKLEATNYNPFQLKYISHQQCTRFLRLILIRSVSLASQPNCSSVSSSSSSSLFSFFRLDSNNYSEARKRMQFFTLIFT